MDSPVFVLSNQKGHFRDPLPRRFGLGFIVGSDVYQLRVPKLRTTVIPVFIANVSYGSYLPETSAELLAIPLRMSAFPISGTLPHYWRNPYVIHLIREWDDPRPFKLSILFLWKSRMSGTWEETSQVAV